MASKKDITNYAHTLLTKFKDHTGLRLYYELRKATIQNFKEDEWYYFLWLLAAINPGYHKRILKCIREMNPDVSENMKAKLGIQQGNIPFSVVHNTKKIPMEKVVPPESNMEIVSEILLEQDGVGPSRSELDMDERRRT